MCQKSLRDARLPSFLLRIDQEMAAEAQKEGCVACGAALDKANYPRKPRSASGIGWGDPVHQKRLSFCCREEGCRRRRTPPSVRFLGRKVYLGAVVVLVTVMFHGLTRGRVRQIKEAFGIGARTLGRWLKWWREIFAESTFFVAACGSFVPAVATERLPLSLLERFSAPDESERTIALLRFIAPITTSSG